MKVYLPLIEMRGGETLPFGPVTLHACGAKGLCIELPDLKEREINSLALDTLYCLYFSLNAHRIYEGEKSDPLTPFLKVYSHEVIGTPVYAFEISQVDEQLKSTLGQLLDKLYASSPQETSPDIPRIMQAIRYFIDRDLPLIDLQGYNPRHRLLMLGLSFEVLLKLNCQKAEADMRQHLRRLLHLKYNRPVELLWKWVDQFYEARKMIAAGEKNPPLIFQANPNVQIPIDQIGEKLLIYSIYDVLFQKHLIQGKEGTPSTPDDFKTTPASHTLVYFWPEEALIQKLVLLSYPKVDGEKHTDDLEMLSSLWKEHKELQKRYKEGSVSSQEVYINTTQKDEDIKVLHLHHLLP